MKLTLEIVAMCAVVAMLTGGLVAGVRGLGELPRFGFARRHRPSLEEIPRPLTSEGLSRPQQWRLRCSCGWSGPVTSQKPTMAAVQDHVEARWLRRRDEH